MKPTLLLLMAMMLAGCEHKQLYVIQSGGDTQYVYDGGEECALIQGPSPYFVSPDWPMGLGLQRYFLDYRDAKAYAERHCKGAIPKEPTK